MKIVFTITLILAIIISVVIGCAAIFDFITADEAKGLLIKSVAAIILLGGASAILAMLTRTKNSKS